MPIPVNLPRAQVLSTSPVRLRATPDLLLSKYLTFQSSLTRSKVSSRSVKCAPPRTRTETNVSFEATSSANWDREAIQQRGTRGSRTPTPRRTSRFSRPISTPMRGSKAVIPFTPPDNHEKDSSFQLLGCLVNCSHSRHCADFQVNTLHTSEPLHGTDPRSPIYKIGASP